MFKYYKNLFSLLFQFKVKDDDLSLDDSMQSILDDIKSRDEDDESESNDLGQADIAANLQAEESADSKDEATDEAGQAESAEDDNAREASSGKNDQEADAEASRESKESETGDSESESGPIRPPSSWSAQGKQAFNSLPKHIQQEVVKRESDFHKGIQEYKDDAGYGRSIRDIVSPYMPEIQRQGSTPEKAIQSMLQTSYALTTASPQEKGQLLMQVAQQYGADMSQFLGEQAQQGQGRQRNSQQDNYVRQLEQRLAQIEQGITYDRQAVQQQQTAEAQNSIEAFKNEVDESGNVKHVYFDDLRDDMANMIDLANQQGRQLSLQEAYENAAWARPDIRKLIQADAQRQDSEKRKKEQAKAAREAKKKGSVNLSTKGNHANTSQQPVGSIDDTMRETLRQMNERNS